MCHPVFWLQNQKFVRLNSPWLSDEGCPTMGVAAEPPDADCDDDVADSDDDERHEEDRQQEKHHVQLLADLRTKLQSDPLNGSTDLHSKKLNQ